MSGDPSLLQARGKPGGHKSEIGVAPTSIVTKPLRAGLAGRGIEESRSPRMHEAEGARLGLAYEYRLFDFDRLGFFDDELPRLIAQLQAEGFAGMNVTHPFKERVVEYLDHLSPDAEAIGAVNTIVFQPEGTVGHNTDCWGFAESFRRSLQAVRLDTVVLIGAGGAGMAVARALVELGVRNLEIFDIEERRAERLVETLSTSAASATVATDLKDAIRSADGLVNATPVGMAKYPGMPIDAASLRRELWIADIVYFPAETALLRAATAAGCRTLPGAGMAIFQAVRAFKLITGAEPDPAEMERHFQAQPPR